MRSPLGSPFGELSAKLTEGVSRIAFNAYQPATRAAARGLLPSRLRRATSLREGGKNLCIFIMLHNTLGSLFGELSAKLTEGVSRMASNAYQPATRAAARGLLPSRFACHISLRLGHLAALTCHRYVIHYREAASLPLGREARDCTNFTFFPLFVPLPQDRSLRRHPKSCGRYPDY